MFNAVWSTRDGVEWRPHATPPWAGEIWPNVVVWDDELLISSATPPAIRRTASRPGTPTRPGTPRTARPGSRCPSIAPVPGSVQGVAATESQLVLAGSDRSVWGGRGRVGLAALAVRGRSAAALWAEQRGADALRVEAPDAAARPVLVSEAFGPGSPGLQFDGSRHVLALPDDAVDAQAAGRSVFWVARAPLLPGPWGWTEDYAPLETVVGGPAGAGGMPESGLGLLGSELVVVDRQRRGLGAAGEPLYARLTRGGPAARRGRDAADGHHPRSAEGTLQFFVDGAAVGPPQRAVWRGPRMVAARREPERPLLRPNSRFAGTLGAVWIAPGIVIPATLSRLAAWARGRFGSPR